MYLKFLIIIYSVYLVLKVLVGQNQMVIDFP